MIILWSIHTKKDSLWIQWIHALRRQSIWEWEPRKGDSPLLNQLARVRNVLVDTAGQRSNAANLLSSWREGNVLDITKVYHSILSDHAATYSPE